MVLRRDTSTLGTVVGIAFVIVAIGGRIFLDWRWGESFANQPVAFIVGLVAAVVAVGVTYRLVRS
ncbi:multidrug transporter [Halomarina salina]|uniref:Multidrug transporter n=1 Tax=Halomarina salina TaxID=1872699 RepID=A0ABD5RVD1_9EURY|nr:multidrug transporter [Halomarina salina]